MSAPPAFHDVDALLDQAELALQRGALAQAETLCHEVLQQQSEQPDALYMLGFVALQRRQWDRGIELLRRALAEDPEFAQAYFALGVAQIETAQWEGAVDSFSATLTFEPDHVEALINVCAALGQLGRWQDGLAHLQRALQLQPRHPLARFHRGNAYLALERFAEALQDYDELLSHQPQDHAAWINRGRALTALKRFEDALTSLDRGLAGRPESVAGYVCRGDALHQWGQLDDALRSCEQALAIQPTDVSALLLRGNVLQQMGRHADALESYRQALALAPQNARVHANMAVALRALGQPEAALTACTRALELAPDLMEALMNQAGILLEQGRLAEAQEKLAELLTRQPHDAQTHVALGCCYLLQGQYEQGWPEFEWRLRQPGNRIAQLSLDQPLWSGEQDLRGRTILLVAEDGFGDTLQFCRYVPRVAALGARVILHVPAPLKRVMASLKGVTQVVTTGELPPTFDYYCPLLSLPHRFRTTLATIPAVIPYLHADEQEVKTWEQRISHDSRPRLGLVWSGNPKLATDAQRSLPLSLLLSALPTSVTLYSLQKEVRDVDRQALEVHPHLRHFETQLTDFCDTAALVAHMDLVISVDTAVAHLAGAMGQKVWVLQRWMPDWRWMMERCDSPWYPSMLVLRQQHPNRWDTVLDGLRTRLVTDFGA